MFTEFRTVKKLDQQRRHSVLLQIYSGNFLQKVDILDLSLIKLLQNQQRCNFLCPQCTYSDRHNSLLFYAHKMRTELTVEVAAAAACHEIIEHLEWKQRIFEFTKVQLQNTGHRVDVLSIQLVQQWIFPWHKLHRANNNDNTNNSKFTN